MKGLLKKIIVIFMLMLMMINNSLLLIISDAAEEINKIIDENKINPVFELGLEKYVNYDVDDDKGTVVQIDLKTGIEYKDGEEYKPLKSTGILLELPKINDEYPESIEVIGKSTKATNGGNEAKDFRHVYDKETGEMKLVTVNEADEEGNIYSENITDARDEYSIICYYSSNCYNDRNEQRSLQFSGFIQANIADDSEITKKVDIAQSFEVSENISGLISTNVQTTDIYNGYINSNSQNGTNYATEYTENLEINISKKELSDEIKVSTDSNFINKQDQVIDTEEIIYKSTKIDKNKVLDILGENGYLQILNENGDVIGEVNKDTEVGENNIYEITYDNEINEIIIKTSKPLKVGTIIIQNTKEIKASMVNLDNKKVQDSNKIECFNNIQEKNQETGEIVKEEQKEIYNFSVNHEIQIKDAETKIDVSIDKDSWTNNIQNDVIITATLVANESKYNLFKQPVIEFELPNEVENVILGDISLLYNNGLNILNSEVIEKNNRKVIKITLEGQQKEYITSSMISGSELIIPATVILKGDIQSVDSSINVTYTNDFGNKTDYINEGKTNKQINIYINSIQQNAMEQTISLFALSPSSIQTTSSGISTEVVANVGRDILKEGDTVYKGEAITFTIKLKNDSDTTINNIKTIANIPDGAVFVERNTFLSDVAVPNEEGNYQNEIYAKSPEIKEVKIEKESLAPGEEYQGQYKVLIDDTTNSEIINEFKTYINNNETETKQLKLLVKDAELSVNLYPADKDGGFFTYYTDIKNLTNTDINNVTVEFTVGKELNILNVSSNCDSKEYDENTGIIKLKYNTIKANEKQNIKIYANPKNFEQGKYEYNIMLSATAYSERNIHYRSELNSNEFDRANIKIVQTSDTEGEKLFYKDEIEYNFVVTNEGKVGTNIKIADNLPDGVKGVYADYEYYEYTEDGVYEKKKRQIDISSIDINENEDETEFLLSTYIPSGENINIKIRAQADSVFEATETINIATVSGDEIFPVISNAIKNTVWYFGKEEEPPVNPDEPTNPDVPTDPEEPINPDKPTAPEDPSKPGDSEEKYNISGLVWLDSNNDGKRDFSETPIKDITVKLFDMNTNEIVKDADGNKYITNTDKDGNYSFFKVKSGRYIVLFEFDTDKYNTTTYQKNSIQTTVNSDAIIKQVNIDGKTYNAGITDVIQLNKNYTNIDMGLVERTELDFRLDKYVTKISTNNSKESKEYSFNDAKLAKVDIPAKQLADTIVTIEYKIVVTNEGNTSGYVKSIIDYLPSDLKFDSANNANWIKDSDGNLVNTSLVTKKLEPGQSAEVSLILTAQNVTKNIENNAEIKEIYNVNNLKDIDSIENNKDIKEDDYSSAQVIISIKTGIVLNILKIILILAIIAIMFLVLYKYKGKNIKMFMIIMFSMIGIVSIISYKGVSTAVTLEEHNNSANHGPRILSLSNLGYHINSSTGRWEWANWIAKPATPHELKLLYWCITPNEHLCYEDHYYVHVACFGPFYKESDLASAITSISGGSGIYNILDELSFEFSDGNIPTSIGTNKSSESIVDYSIINKNNTNKVLVGPFKVDWNLNGATHTYSIKDENGNNISDAVLCDKNGTAISAIPKGENFYVYVPMDIKKVKVEVKFSYIEKGAKKGVVVDEYILDPSVKISSCEKTHAQTLIDPDQLREDMELTETVSWAVTIPKAKISVVKKDESNITTDLRNTKITIVGDPNDNKVKNYKDTITMSNNTFVINDLLPGKYIVKEIDAPTNYSFELQKDQYAIDNYGVVIEGEETVSKNETGNIVLKNKQYANLVITKQDEQTGRRLSDVTFRIFLPGKGYIQKGFVNGSQGRVAQVQFTNNETLAENFITDSTGQIKLINLPICSSQYQIVEVAISEFMKSYYEVDSTVKQVPNLVNNKGDINNNTQMIVTNKQLYIDIKGFVWEDIAKDNKMTSYDNLYEPEREEEKNKKIRDIPVKLYKNNGTLIAQMKTDSNGEYCFKGKDLNLPLANQIQVLLADLSQYYIEFEYNGLKYKNVDLQANFLPTETSSKAKEKDSDRDIFNKKYSIISGGIDKQNGLTRGFSIDESGNISNNLIYTGNKQYTSELVGNTKYTVDSATNSVLPVGTNNIGVKMNADTRTAGYEFKQVVDQVHQYVVENVNLGIRLREQVDLAISTDVYNIQLAINEYTHTYNYKKRAAYENYSDEFVTGYDAAMDAFSVSVKNNAGNYRDLSYEREIYPSYIAYSNNKENDSNRLRVFVTYKITINNQSTSLYGEVRELRNYCDSNYKFVESKSNQGNIIWEKNGNEGNAQLFEADLTGKKISPTENLVIYLKYEVEHNKIISLLTEEKYTTAINTTEILSYSTYDSSGKIYASIDKDSAPGNSKYLDISTYEDDIDAAPDLVIKKSEKEKTISGIVFEDSIEDSTSGTKKNGDSIDTDEYLGDGKYDDTKEKVVEGAKVRLVDKDGNIAKLYQFDSGTGTVKPPENAETETNNGKYEFVGLVPGIYYLEYEYGNKGTDLKTVVVDSNGVTTEVTTQDYKSTIITNDYIKSLINDQYVSNSESWKNYDDASVKDEGIIPPDGYWYENDYAKEFSSAVDDYTKRKYINNELSNNYYQVKYNYDNEKDDANLHNITARTPIMSVAIQDTDRQVTQYEDNEKLKNEYSTVFGIVERPRQDFEITKEISYVKVTLANGQVLIEGDPRAGTINYLTYPEKGILKIEIDNEIIEGATLNYTYVIDVKNLSDMNYNSIEYYNFGLLKGDLVTTKIKSFVDYLDKEVVYLEQTGNNVWELKVANNFVTDTNQQLISEDTKRILGKQYNFYQYTGDTFNTELKPGDDKTVASMDVSKLLSSSDDMLFDNHVEFLHVYNPVGRFYNGTPGNYDLETEECDNNKDKNRAILTIVPPTGAENIVIYILIGIGCLALLSGGIIFIKKKIL